MNKELHRLVKMYREKDGMIKSYMSIGDNPYRSIGKTSGSHTWLDKISALNKNNTSSQMIEKISALNRHNNSNVLIGSYPIKTRGSQVNANNYQIIRKNRIINKEVEDIKK